MRKLMSLAAALLMVVAFTSPAFAQVGLEEGTILSPTKHSGGVIAVFSSDIDTINATANDTTGIMPIAQYSAIGPLIVYTVASGGTVSIKIAVQVAPALAGPWYTVSENDTIAATGSSVYSITEFTSYKMPFVRVIADGIGSNDAASNFTYLYIVWVLDTRYAVDWKDWRP